MHTDLERRLLRLVCLREECGFRCRSVSPVYYILFLFSCCELVWQFIMDLLANGRIEKVGYRVLSFQWIINVLTVKTILLGTCLKNLTICVHGV